MTPRVRPRGRSRAARGFTLVEILLAVTLLSLLMALAYGSAGKGGLGARMGAVGACISLGVATGAPLGGFIGGIGHKERIAIGSGLGYGDADVIDHANDIFNLFGVGDVIRKVVVHLSVG